MTCLIYNVIHITCWLTVLLTNLVIPSAAVTVTPLQLPKAVLGQFPYHVDLKSLPKNQVTYRSFCSGVLLAASKVVTENSCVIVAGLTCNTGVCAKQNKFVDIKGTYVVASSLNRTAAFHQPGSQWRRIASVIVSDDEVLVIAFTEEPFVLNSNVNTIPYASKHMANQNDRCILAGYEFEVELSGVVVLVVPVQSLIYENVTVLKDKKVDSRMMPEKYVSIRSDNRLRGLSGAPLVCSKTLDPNEGEAGVLVGLRYPGIHNDYTIYVRVSAYHDFITSKSTEIKRIMAERCAQPDAAYAAACSAQTLCARRGFLHALLPELAALPAPAWWSELERRSDQERLQACRDHHELMAALEEVMSRVTPVSRGKDARASRERRRAAEEELARAGDARGKQPHAAVERALALASEAVLKAPDAEDDEDATLALALWTRSAVLLARGRAPGAAGARGEGGALPALADLRLALRARLPARMRAHYYWRSGHCYRECGEATRAKVSFELALRLMRDEPQRAQLQRDLDELARAPPALAAPPAPPAEISVVGGAKPNMPSLSKLCKVVEEEGKGRFVAARAAVRPGAVLLSEPAYAACLLPDHLGTHCLHCFTRLSVCREEAPVWCARCAGVAFCSLRCRERGLRYHRHECAFQDLFIGSGMSILSHIALRMVTQLGLAGTLDAHARYIAGTAASALAHDDIEGGRKAKMKTRKERLNRSKKGLKMTEKNGDESKSKEKEEKEKYEEDENLELKTAQIYSLCTHSEQRTGEDYVMRLVVAVFLAECLQRSGFFDSCAPDDLEKSRWAVTAVLVRNLQLLQFNAHEVSETLREAPGAGGAEGGGGRARVHHVAVAIYPTGALFNHECFPAVARYFSGRRLVLTATRPLAAGAPVAECYGPSAALRPAAARRRALAARYWFTCTCEPCARPELWPTLSECKDQPPPLRCETAGCAGALPGARPAVRARCPACGAEHEAAALTQRIDEVDECHRLFQEGARLLDELRYTEARGVLCRALERFHAVAAAPRRAAYAAHESLRAALAAAGNSHDLPPAPRAPSAPQPAAADNGRESPTRRPSPILLD